MNKQKRRLRPEPAMHRPLIISCFLILTFQGISQQTDTLRFDTLRTAVITTTRLPVSASESVLAVSSLNAERLRTAQAQLSLAESLGAIPGVFTMGDANFSQDLRISIRGFGARAGFGIRGIKLLLDGIPESSPDGQAQVDNLDIAAVSRMEVLRGASGGLWGNASGGVISLGTDPVPAEKGHGFAEIRSAAGAFGFQQWHAKAGARRGKTGFTASISHLRLDGYREHAALRNTLANAKIAWSPDTTSTLTLLLNLADSPRADDPGALTAEQVATDRHAANANNVKFNAGESLQQGKAALLFEKKTGARQVLRLRAYAAGRDFENRLAFQNGGQVAFQRLFAGGGGQYEWSARHTPLQLTAGVDFDRQADQRQRYQNLDGERGEQNLDQEEIFAGTGAYALARWTPVLKKRKDLVTLSGGLRYDAVLLRVNDHFESDGDQSGKEWFQRASPWGGLLLRLHPRLNLFANTTTNFETPTLTELSNNPAGTGGFSADLKPQRTLSFETGVRNSGRRFDWELALFRTRTRDELTPYEIAGQPGRTYYRNAGEVLRQGVEASLNWLPARGLALLLAWSWSDFHFVEYTTPAADLKEKRLPVLPRQLGHAEVRWNHPGGLFAFAGARLTGDFFADDANTEQIGQTVLLKMRAGWRRNLGSFTLEVFAGADNLGDAAVYNNVRPNAAGGRYFEPGAGRSWLAGVSLRRNWW